MISYTLQVKPAALAIHRMLPAKLSDIRVQSGMSKASCYDIVKYLLVVRQAYVARWDGLDPVLAQGSNASAPRPCPDETELQRNIKYRAARAAYMKEYARTHKADRQAYRIANKERIAQTRAALAQAKAAIRQQPPQEIKTSWIKL